MTVGTINTYDTLTSQPNAGTFALSWNPTATAFGFARYNLFQRFDTTGSQLGGAITLSHSNRGFIVHQYNGYWYILSNDSNVYSALCSKISSVGNLQCNAISTGDSAFPDGDLIQNMISATSFLTKSNTQLKTYDISTTTCNITTNTTFPSPNEIISSDVSYLDLGSSITSLAYKSTNNRLVFGVITSNKFTTETVITNGDLTLSNIEAKSISGKVFVFYSLAGKSYFVKSNEAI